MAARSLSVIRTALTRAVVAAPRFTAIRAFSTGNDAADRLISTLQSELGHEVCGDVAVSGPPPSSLSCPLLPAPVPMSLTSPAGEER